MGTAGTMWGGGNDCGGRRRRRRHADAWCHRLHVVWERSLVVGIGGSADTVGKVITAVDYNRHPRRRQQRYLPGYEYFKH